ncbi:MAG: restriction endonuclease [Bacteroidota bacterium]
MVSPIQVILFGSPGTGKSYEAARIAEDSLNITLDPHSKTLKNTIKTVFHPEYTNADFIGKLLPLTQDYSVTYKYYPGHFLRILGQAYEGIINNSCEHFLLIIDELNRGNAASIFGAVFQLLDREEDGWSSYEIDISEMELLGLLESMGYKPILKADWSIEITETDGSKKLDSFCEVRINQDESIDTTKVSSLLKSRKIAIPPNLSIIGTINTSDESIFYLDSAFKRRWNWRYFEAPNGLKDLNKIPQRIKNSRIYITGGSEGETINKSFAWFSCIIGINNFIRANHKTIRKIEDKQIGWWFIKPSDDNKISQENFQDKLMFYLWDGVFSRDKRPLSSLIQEQVFDEVSLITFSDFVQYTVEFIEAVYDRAVNKYPVLSEIEDSLTDPEIEKKDQVTDVDFDDIPF